MDNKAKTKAQLVAELVEARQRVAELEGFVGDCRQAEEALREREQHLSTIVANLSGAVYEAVLHPDGTLSLPYISAGTRQISGLEPQEAMAHPERLYEIMHPDDRLTFEQLLAASLNSRQPFIYEYRITTISGQLKWIRDIARVVKQENDDLVLHGIALDITEQKALEERWRHYEFIANTSREFMALINQNRVYEAANDAYCRGHGKARKEIVGRTVAEVWGEERYLTRIKAVLDDSFAGREAYYQGWFEFARLGRRYFEVAYYPYRDNFGVVTHVAVVWRDETERQQAEETLRESLQQLKFAYDQTTIYAQEITAEITERRQIEMELRQRTAQLETLRQIGLELTAELELSALLQSIASRAAKLLDSTSGSIYLYRAEEEALELVVVAGHWTGPVGAVLKRGEGLAGKVWQTGQPVIVDDYNTWSGRIVTFDGYPALAIVGVPIYWGPQFLGVLNVADQSRTFAPADAQLLSLLAIQAAIAIQNARLYAETNKRLEQQIALREATNLISASLDLQTVLSRIAEQMGRAVNASSAYLCSYDPQPMTSTVLAEYFGPRATDNERISDLGVTYDLPRDFTYNFDILLAGKPEHIHLDDPHLSRYTESHMEQFGAQTILNIPLQVHGRVIAFAELWESHWRREFTTEELDLCQALAQQAAIAIEHARLYTEARESEDRLRTALKEKEVLLKEIHHRVKNNLQVISSLLHLQAEYIHDPQALNAFADSQYRVKSMALVHEYLYQSENLAQIDFGEYLRHLVSDLLRAYGQRARAVSVQIDISGPGPAGSKTTKAIWLDIHLAIPCGLIVQELLSNALKHAFPASQAGQIWVELQADTHEITLRIRDDGVGLPKGLEFQHTESMGLQLVNMLTLQLKGNIELEPQKGTSFKLTFSRHKHQQGNLDD